MGNSPSFNLYFENNRENIRDTFKLNLPKLFHKSIIFDYVYQRHGYHECILTLEYYINDQDIKEFENSNVTLEEIIKYNKNAYIKISNKGNCKCKKKINENNNENNNSNKANSNINNINELNEESKELYNKRIELEIEVNKEKISNLQKELNELKNKNNDINNQKNNKNSNNFEIDNILLSEIYDKIVNNENIKKSDSFGAPTPSFFLINYNKNFENLIQFYEKTIIYPTIQDQIKNTYTNFFDKLDYKTFHDKIFNYLIFKDMYIAIKKKLEENIKNICKNITRTKHFNIILLGREGVGKSTLLNSILKLDGKNKAETGVGDSVTKSIKIYSNPEMNFLRLYDTQGIGIKEDNSAEKILSDIKKLIEEKITNKSPNPDDLIHCLWFCFNGRFGEIDYEIINKLSETYSDKSLPFIIVHTYSLSRKEARKRINDIMEKYKVSEENICQVLAKDEEIDEEEDEEPKKSFGLENLMNLTINKINAAVESANYEFTKYHIFIEVDNFLDKISEFKKDNKEIISEISEISFDKLKEKLALFLFEKAKNLIKSIINKNEIQNPEELLRRFELFLFDTISETENLFNKIIEEISKKHSLDIGAKLLGYVKDDKVYQNEKSFMYQYQEDLRSKTYPLRIYIEKQVKEYIFNELEKRVMNYFRLAIKNSFIDYAREKDEKIKDLFEEFSKESVKYATEDIKEKIEKSFPPKKK